MKLRSVLCCLALTLGGSGLFAQTPGDQPLKIDLTPDGSAFMELFLPEHPSGRGVVCCPGGGYIYLSLELTGTDWAPFFNERGIALSVVHYRLPNGDRSLPIADVENAMRMMRDSAAVWHLNPRDIGIMGSSAGGHLASVIATQSPDEVRPDFQILFYPVITMGPGTHDGSKENFLGDGCSDENLVKQYSSECQVRPESTPPAILMLADNDLLVPSVPNSIAYYCAMRNAGISCTLHIYPSGGHGFGFRKSYVFHDLLLADLSAWLETLPSATDSGV